MAKKSIELLRTIVIVLLTAVVLVFAAQNLDTVEVTFLAWTFSANVAVLVLVPFAAALVLGRLDRAVHSVMRRLRTKKSAPSPAKRKPLPPPEPAPRSPQPVDDSVWEELEAKHKGDG